MILIYYSPYLFSFMGRGNFLAGKGRGSIADTTYYQFNGKQVARFKQTKIKNPRSVTQRIQRVLIKTTTSAYSVLQSVCSGSLEGYTAGAKCYSEWLSKNYRVVRALVDVGSVDSNSWQDTVYVNRKIDNFLLEPNRWLVSSGSLNSADFGYSIHAPLPVLDELESEECAWFVNEESVVDNTLGGVRYGAFCDALNIPIGSQLSVLLLYYDPSLFDAGVDRVPQLLLSKGRLVLWPGTVELGNVEGARETAFIGGFDRPQYHNQGFYEGVCDNANPQNMNMRLFFYNDSSAKKVKIGLSTVLPLGVKVVGGCVIVSYFDSQSKSWKYSTEVLSYPDSNALSPWSGETLGAAVSSFTGGGLRVNDPQGAFLQNAPKM